MTHRQPIRRVRRATSAFLLAGALVTAVLAPPASAAPLPGLYGATGVLGNDTAPPSNLYRIDPDTGDATTVGPIGYAVGGLALDPTTGTLYGVTTARELTSVERFLIRLDDTTGAGAIVGSLGTNHIGDIAFDNAGRLYGWSESRRADGGFAAVDDLVRIDKATGAVADVGDSGLNLSWGNGIAFDSSGVLFGSLNGDYGWLWTINPANGAVNRGPRLTGSPNTTGGAGIAAATFGCRGTTLYGVVNDFGDPPTYLVTIDTTSGDITNRGATVTALDALEWVCATPQPGPGPQPASPAPQPSGPPAVADRLAPRLAVAGVSSRGCVRRSFTVRVRATDASALDRVVVKLNGRTLRRTTAASFRVRVRVASLRPGRRHTLRVVAVDSSGNRSATRRTFRRCAAQVQPPSFTG